MSQDLLPKETHSEPQPGANCKQNQALGARPADRSAYSQRARGGGAPGAAAAAWRPAPSCSRGGTRAAESPPLTPARVRSASSAGTLSEPVRGERETVGRKHKDGLDSSLPSPCSITTAPESHTPRYKYTRHWNQRHWTPLYSQRTTSFVKGGSASLSFRFQATL